jgi:catechol-2,3-dioxygenase
MSAMLSHVAMSVSEGTLTENFRSDLLEFYGRTLGWREMELFRRPDRLTIAVGASSYINLRERPDSMVTHGYEHIGILVGSAETLSRIWSGLASEHIEVHLEPFTPNEHDEGSFRFRYLLPMAVEVQFRGVG